VRFLPRYNNVQPTPMSRHNGNVPLPRQQDQSGNRACTIPNRCFSLLVRSSTTDCVTWSNRDETGVGIGMLFGAGIVRLSDLVPVTRQRLAFPPLVYSDRSDLCWLGVNPGVGPLKRETPTSLLGLMGRARSRRHRESYVASRRGLLQDGVSV
jgi:hypothetical protein